MLFAFDKGGLAEEVVPAERAGALGLHLSQIRLVNRRSIGRTIGPMILFRDGKRLWSLAGEGKYVYNWL
jgi:hypothetical protein